MIDAHTHLQMPALAELDLSHYWNQVDTVVVNGTHPKDWPQVAELAQNRQVYASYGVHPWETQNLPGDWLELLRHYLTRDPNAGVGEIGLDKWIRSYDLPLQKDVFLTQLALATELERPITIHCLKAWGTLKELLHSYEGPAFLLHAYAGPVDYIPFFAERGAYFSFSPYFLLERKKQTCQNFLQVPRERLLLETDAPSMLGPRTTWCPEQSSFSPEHQHPGNIESLYHAVAPLLAESHSGLVTRVEENFRQWWNQS